MTSPDESVPLTPEDPRLIAFLDDYWGALRRQAATDPERWLSTHPEGKNGSGDLHVLAALRDAVEILAEDSHLEGVVPEGGVPLPPGTRLGECRIESLLSRGGMGCIYRAFHDRLCRPVALKVLAPERRADPAAVARFHREMAAGGRLDHPNIVRAVHAGEADGIPFLTLDFIAGRDLARLVKERQFLPLADACEIGRQAALALAHAHEHGLVHRDIKPSNLMLSPDGTVKVLDFGLSLLQDTPAPDGLTTSGQVLGTADYMAPEQWDEAHTVGLRADLYSLGCTLYCLLTGRPPFGDSEHASFGRKMRAHAQELPRPISGLRPEVPPGLAAVLERLLQKRPEDRFASAAAVATALEPFTVRHDLAALLRGEARQAVTLVGPSPRRWHRWLTAGLGTAAVFFLGVVLYVATDHGTVRIELSDRAAEVEVRINGERIAITGLNRPLTVRAGRNQLQITGPDFETHTEDFVVRRGAERVVQIQLLRKGARAQEQPRPLPGATPSACN